MQTKHLHILLHTFIPSLPPSTCTSHSCHHHISTGRHPIIPNLTFHMPEPPQSTPPHHLVHALYTQKTVQIHTFFLSFSDMLHNVHIHLTIICSVISKLFRFAFFIAQVSIPYVNALWTQALYIFPFKRYDALWAIRIGAVHKVCHAIFDDFCPPPLSQNCHKSWTPT